MNARDDREARIARAAASTERILDRARRQGQLPGVGRDAGPNERFADALAAAGITPEELAKKVMVDRKTVERWISKGRVPFPVHQFAVEELTGVKASELWPERRRNTPPPSSPEKVNERLRQAVFDARMTHEQLAEHLGMNPKTVERWITKGRVPHLKHQVAAAVAVGVPEYELWPVPVRPELLAQEQTIRTQSAENREHVTRNPVQHNSIDRSSSPVSPRIRALMSWVDSAAPLKESDVHADIDRYTGPMVDKHHQAARPARPVRQTYGRSDGLEHTR